MLASVHLRGKLMSRPTPNALVAGLAALLLIAPGTSAAGNPSHGAADHVEVLRLATSAQPRAVAAVADPCNDRSYNLHGAKWRSTFRWYFRASSTPASLTRRAAAGAIRRGVANITTARNDCGRADRSKAAAKYLGYTSARPSCKRMLSWTVGPISWIPPPPRLLSLPGTFREPFMRISTAISRGRDTPGRDATRCLRRSASAPRWVLGGSGARAP